jgi:hypothetical protein
LFLQYNIMPKHKTGLLINSSKSDESFKIDIQKSWSR